MYSYAYNNPLSYIDPSGLCSKDAGGNYHDEDDSGKLEFKGSCVQGNTATAQQGSIWELLTSPQVPRYVENDKPLSEDAQKVLTKVGENTRAIDDLGETVAACMAERFLGVPLGDIGAGGGAMIAAGQPWLPTRAKMGSNSVNILGRQSGSYTLSILSEHALPTEGTSLAAATSHAAATALRPVVGRRIAGVVGRLGRGVPVVGAALTAADAAAITACVAAHAR
jgi:hypothetical protein